MILTCPDCATRYFVDAAKLRGGGKTVRCASCGARWTAGGEPDIQLSVFPEIGAIAEEPSFAPAPAPVEETRAFPDALPKQIRAKHAEKGAHKRALAHGIVWACLIAVLAGALAASMVFRVEVVRIIPRAASAYAMVGLKVNSVGLTFENVSARPALQDGRSTLVVSGEIRNIEGEAVTAPALRITILSKTGARVTSVVHHLEDARVAPGQSHHFVIPILDPPPSAEDIEVGFELGGRKTKGPALRPAVHAEDAHGAHAPALRQETHDPEAEPAVLQPASYTGPAPAHAEPAHAPAGPAPVAHH